ncbi:hypothetical protein T484DRAFT_1810104, partial [Baffinella frigidus]
MGSMGRPLPLTLTESETAAPPHHHQLLTQPVEESRRRRNSLPQLRQRSQRAAGHPVVTNSPLCATSSALEISPESPPFRRMSSLCHLDLDLMRPRSRTESMLGNSTSRSGNRRSSSVASREPSEGGYNFGRRPSSTFSKSAKDFADLERLPSAASSQWCWPSLPEWPALDPAAFGRGKALLGSMEMDPACFSRDDLCHLALEIFQQAGLPEELAADEGRVKRFILA